MPKEVDENSITPILIPSATQIVDNVCSFGWSNNPDNLMQSIINLSALLISYDTVALKGSDFDKAEATVTEILSRLGYSVVKHDPIFSKTSNFGRVLHLCPPHDPYENREKPIELAVHFHLDTVGFGGKYARNIPYIDKNNNILGRGSTDVKCLTAAALHSLVEIYQYCPDKLPHVVVTLDEEAGNLYSGETLRWHLKNLKNIIDIEPSSNIHGAVLREIARTHTLMIEFDPLQNESIQEAILNLIPEFTYRHLTLRQNQLTLVFDYSSYTSLLNCSFVQKFNILREKYGFEVTEWDNKPYAVKESNLFKIIKEELSTTIIPQLRPATNHMLTVATDVNGSTYIPSGNFNTAAIINFPEKTNVVVLGSGEMAECRHAISSEAASAQEIYDFKSVFTRSLTKFEP